MPSKKTKYATLGPYRLGRTLGEGVTAKVKYAVNEEDEGLAIKIFKKEDNKEDYHQNELDFFRNVPGHESIVNFTDRNYNADYTNKAGVVKQNRYYIAMEYIEGGEFFKFIEQGPLEAPIVKKYFKELLHGMHHIHSHGLAHRDLKPDNLLITTEAKLKVADFGLSHKLDFHTKKEEEMGTKTYAAPELQGCSECKTYSGDQVDLFSAGVILYIMMTATMPFDSATAEDEQYQNLVENRSYDFWSKQESEVAQTLHPDFKNLVEVLLMSNPDCRPTLADVFGHVWMTNDTKFPVATDAECLAMYQERFVLTDTFEKSQTEELKAKKNMKMQEGLGQVMRSGTGLEGQALYDSKWFATYDPVQNKPNKSFARYTSWTPDLIIEHFRNEFTSILEKYNYEELNDKKEEQYWQFSFKVKDKSEAKMKVKISQATAEVYAVEFKFIKGDKLFFHKIFKQLVEDQEIKIFNDIPAAPKKELVDQFQKDEEERWAILEQQKAEEPEPQPQQEQKDSVEKAEKMGNMLIKVMHAE